MPAALKAGSQPPWVGLAAAVWVQIASGNAYSFPLYSHTLKSVLGLSQQQLTILGVANDLGENVGILPGIASNKYPPLVVLLVGVLVSFCGYGVIWLAVSETVRNMPYWVMDRNQDNHLHRDSSGTGATLGGGVFRRWWRATPGISSWTSGVAGFGG